MKINTSISVRDRSKMTLKDFKGLDTLSAPINVSGIHATEMQNLISRDGVNHKRFGWKERLQIKKYFDLSTYSKPIRGIFNFTIHGESFTVVYTGTIFYLVDLKKNSYQNLIENSFKDSTTTDGTVEIAPVNRQLLTDTECKFFMNGNKVYFVGCGDYLVFSKWKNGKFELRRVIGNEDVYVPTTTENISCEEVANAEGAPKRITAEERNILSPYVKNLLFGKALADGEKATYYLDQKDFSNLKLTVKRKNGEVVTMENKSEDKAEYQEGDTVNRITHKKTETTRVNTFTTQGVFQGNSLTWDLEMGMKTITVLQTEGGMVYYDLEFFDYVSGNVSLADGVKMPEIADFYPPKRFYATLYVKGNVVAFCGAGDIRYEITHYSVSVHGEKTITIKAYLTFQPVSVELDGLYKITFNNFGFVLLNEDTFVVTDSDNIAHADVYPKEGKVVFSPYSKDGKTEEDFYEPVTKDTLNITATMEFIEGEQLVFYEPKAVKFGTEGVTDRLFVVDDTGNTIRWTKDLDFTYFGDKSYLYCGTADKRITGLDRLNDSTLIAVKEYSPQEPSIYVITGSLVASQTEANTEKYTALFNSKGYSVGMGAVGEIITFNGECLMLAKDGLYAITLGENLVVDARYVIHRSRQISNALERYDLSKAKCVTLDNKLYVYVGGEENACFVADNKYVTTFGDDVQNAISYEWWKWTNIPVSVWGFVNNELWFGTEDGKISCFTEDFFDESLTSLDSGDIGYALTDGEVGNEFTINRDVPVSVGEVLQIDCDLYGKITTKKFTFRNGQVKVYLPLSEYEDGEEIIVLDLYGNYNKKTIRKGSTYFYFDFEGTLSNDTISFYKNYNGRKLKIVDIEHEAVGDTNVPRFLVEDASGNRPIWKYNYNPSNADLKAYLFKKNPVVAKWVSGATNLGTSTYSKSLTSLTLTGERDLINRLKYGLKTRNLTKSYEFLRANNDLQFTGLDFETMSLDSQFASTYTKKLNIRNVNFIMFYFLSDTAEDIALDSIQIEFKIHKRNIGVR